MSEHTPGPWKWWTSNSWRRLKRDDRGITQNVLEPYVCRDGHPDLTVSEADMALISAAPDLLHALEMVRDANRTDPHIPPTALACVEDAINKATGQWPGRGCGSDGERRTLMHTRAMEDDEGSFGPWVKSMAPCRACRELTMFRRSWDSNCGGYTDLQYECKNCGLLFWIEGPDA